MRIIYVTSSLPHGNKEAFIIPEIKELKRQGHEVLIVPTYPRGEVLHGDAKPLTSHVISRPLVSAGSAEAAGREFIGNPTGASKVLGCLFRSRSAGVLLRNLVVYPTGLWPADLAREWRADPIHAHWPTVPATTALIAGETAKLPWSITAHRFDIAENNLLEVNAKRACFSRSINWQGAREVADRVSPGTSPPGPVYRQISTETNFWKSSLAHLRNTLSGAPMYDNGRGDSSPNLMRMVMMAIRKPLFSIDCGGKG